jgi:hypothetical protein
VPNACGVPNSHTRRVRTGAGAACCTATQKIAAWFRNPALPTRSAERTAVAECAARLWAGRLLREQHSVSALLRQHQLPSEDRDFSPSILDATLRPTRPSAAKRALLEARAQ